MARERGRHRFNRWTQGAFLLSVVLMTPQLSAAVIRVGDSRIVEVTVYPDRGEVVREATVDLPATIQSRLVYRVVPGLSASAYLTGVGQAPGEYPLLAGPMRVFAGAAYLGVFALPETAPASVLTVPFGLDNRVKVSRLRRPQEHGTEGITGRTRKIEYGFRTTVENLRDEEISLTLEDRIPISEHERIVVEMSKATTPGFTESKQRPGVLLWSVTLAPKEKRDLVLEYAVRFPRDLAIEALE